MRALRCTCSRPPFSSLMLASPRQAPSAQCLCRRGWSLATLLNESTSPDQLLTSIRTAAAASPDWDVDFSALAERGPAVGCASIERQTQMIGHVGAALAQLLFQTRTSTTPTTTPAESGTSSSLHSPPFVRTVRFTLPTPEAVLTLTQLVQTTPLLSTVTSVELIIEHGAVRVGGQGSMNSNDGSVLAQLLRVLAQWSAQQPSWVALSIVSRESSSVLPSSWPQHGMDLTSTGSLVLSSPYSTGRDLWDDAAVTALTELVRSKPWHRLTLEQMDLALCSTRTRQKLWSACETSSASLTHFHVKGLRPAREMINTGLLRRFAKLKSLDVGSTLLEEDAVVKLLKDLHDGEDGIGGWWRLQHLGLSQCTFNDAAVMVMAEQLRAREDEEQQRQQQQATSTPLTLTSTRRRRNDCPDASQAEIEVTNTSSPTNETERMTEADESSNDPTAENGADDDVQLLSLDIASAPLSRTATAFALAGCLVRCHKLQFVNTRHCRLTSDGVSHLAAALQHATELRAWVLCLNRFADEGAATLSKYGKYWLNLREVDLTRCRLTCAGVQSLSLAALPAWGSLEVLRLVGNDLRCPPTSLINTKPAFATSHDVNEGSDQSTGLFAYDPAFMKQHGASGKVPTSYELDRRDRAEGRQRYRGTEAFTDSQARAVRTPLEKFGESLSLCCRLRVLDLSDCALTDVGLRQLTRYFTGGNALAELRLAANPLFTSVEGLDALVEFLGNASRLNTLDLSFSGLGDLGVSVLCDGTPGLAGGALTSMSHLETLELASCAIHSLGWESLAAALPHWPRLRHVSLNYNVVSDTALLVAFMRQLAASAPLLRSVGLMGCVVDARMMQHLRNGEVCRALCDRGVQLHF